MVRTVSSLSAKSDASDSTSTTYSCARYPPSVLSAGWDADDEDCISMSHDDLTPPSPISLTIPKANSVHGPYCLRRPNLRQILANTAEPPWTLAAFMAYLSNNHCLETLEFTMDAGRYKKHYAKMMSRAGPTGIPPSKDREYVQALWGRLVEAYIQQNGTREVNIPQDVRDPILNLRPSELPPSPDKLDPAVAKIYELMEESVLVPFLNSVYPTGMHPGVSSCPPNTAAEEGIPISPQSRHDDHHITYSPRTRNARNSPPPQSVVEPYAHSYTPPSMLNRKSAPSAFNMLQQMPIRQKLAQSTSSPVPARSSRSNVAMLSSDLVGIGPGMTDDSGSANDSPANDSPTTPPTTPPTRSDGADGPHVKRDSGMWKKLGRGLSMKPQKDRDSKKKSLISFKEEQ